MQASAAETTCYLRQVASYATSERAPMRRTPVPVVRRRRKWPRATHSLDALFPRERHHDTPSSILAGAKISPFSSYLARFLPPLSYLDLNRSNLFPFSYLVQVIENFNFRNDRVCLRESAVLIFMEIKQVFQFYRNIALRGEKMANITKIIDISGVYISCRSSSKRSIRGVI